MTSRPLPSKTAREPVAPASRSGKTVRTMTILRFENETSMPQLLGNPQRLPIDAQEVGTAAPSGMDAMIRALAAAKPADLARAKAILLASSVDSPSIGVGWLRAGARWNGPDLPIEDLRGSANAIEAHVAGDEALCPELAAAIADPSVAGVLIDHPQFANIWIALLKPSAISVLNANSRLRIELGHRQFTYEELFPRRGHRLGRLLRSCSSVLAKLLAASGGLVLLGSKLGLF